jgi:predicted DNA-binding protein (MmcQ/YjbR family)
MGHAGRPLTAGEVAVVERLRGITRSLPEVVQVRDGFGHATFRVGKRSFAIIGAQDVTVYLSLKTDLITQDALVRRGPWMRAPYIGQHGWITVVVAPTLDWKEVAELVVEGYRLAAPKRLVRLLDAG